MHSICIAKRLLIIIVFSCVEHVCYIQSQCSVVYIAYIAALICLGYLIATYVSFRTRFYSFNIPCPFGYKTSKAVPVQDGEGHILLTSADADRYKTKDSDYLAGEGNAREGLANITNIPVVMKPRLLTYSIARQCFDESSTSRLRYINAKDSRVKNITPQVDICICNFGVCMCTQAVVSRPHPSFP